MLYSCISSRVVKQFSYSTQLAEVTIEKPWHYKDLTGDSIPGISLDKAYRELISNKKARKV